MITNLPMKSKWVIYQGILLATYFELLGFGKHQ